MTISVTSFTGSQSVSTTEYSLTNGTTTLATQAVVGMYQAVLDLNAVAAGDAFEFRVYEKSRAADTKRLSFYAAFAGAQSCPVWFSPAVLLGAGWEMSIVKTAGTDRTITWSVRGVT